MVSTVAGRSLFEDGDSSRFLFTKSGLFSTCLTHEYSGRGMFHRMEWNDISSHWVRFDNESGDNELSPGNTRPEGTKLEFF